uniref:Transposase n=1 Tax=Echinococcus granulosus TaxID=6210 RepID=A0A068WQU9_ECHGR|nr:hypothetical protein EgrG_000220600 [Echinococcus granulosus]
MRTAIVVIFHDRDAKSVMQRQMRLFIRTRSGCFYSQDLAMVVNVGWMCV